MNSLVTITVQASYKMEQGSQKLWVLPSLAFAHFGAA